MTPRAALAASLALLVLLSGGCAADKPPPRPVLDYPPIPVETTVSPSSAPTSPAPEKPAKKPATRGTVGPLNTVRLTGVRAVALTFDDGPHPEWTPKVLDHLRRAKVRATFCVVGVKARKYPAIMARIVREGHTLCNHSWNHDIQLGKKTNAQIRQDLLRTNREIRRAVPGVRIAHYRQPGGKWTPGIVAVVREMGMTPLHWDVDPSDWDDASTPEIRKRIAQQARPGSIVLMHDGGGDRSRTVGACPQVLTYLRQKFGIVRLRPSDLG